MQNTRTIILHPMPIALLLSAAMHAVIWHGRSIHIEAAPIMESGKTVVQLTLIPSLPSAPKPEIAPPQEASSPPQSMPKPAEPMPKPIDQPSPVPAPTPAAAQTEPVPVSIEQNATMEADKGVTSEAVATSTFHPSYPRISRRRGEEGTVSLSIQIHADGSAGNVTIIQSSGHRRLDKAAFEAARKTRFMPALEHDRAVESTTQLSFTFRLTDD